jgi:dUTP pyrophosphatase
LTLHREYRDQKDSRDSHRRYNTRDESTISNQQSAIVMLPVRIKRLSSSIPLPRYESDGAAAFDLAAAADVTIPPGQVVLVPTGLVIEVPRGMFLGIFARSSTPLKRGLMVANGVGIVDSDYCGPEDQVKVAVLNFTASPVHVSSGDRIAQGVFLPATRVTWQEVDAVRPDSRGGFGSTG